MSGSYIPPLYSRSSGTFSAKYDHPSPRSKFGILGASNVANSVPYIPHLTNTTSLKKGLFSPSCIEYVL